MKDNFKMTEGLNPEILGLNTVKAEEIADELNIYLADLNLLYLKLHNFHWNVVGIGFYDLHEKTEELYDMVAAKLDRVAERILMLGFKPVASMQDSLEMATLKEAPSRDINSTTIASILKNDFASIVRYLRDIASLAGEAKDEYTVTILGEDIGFFEKNIWMFSAYNTR